MDLLSEQSENIHGLYFVALTFIGFHLIGKKSKDEEKIQLLYHTVSIWQGYSFHKYSLICFIRLTAFLSFEVYPFIRQFQH